MAPILGYWDVRGLAEPIRYILHYVGVEFEDKRYAFAGGENFFVSESDWTKEKNSLGLELPNLPYYIDDDVKITQSAVIIRYLARKHGLYFPEGGDQELIKLEMIEEHVRDYLQAVSMLAFNPKMEEIRELFKKSIQVKLADLSNFLNTKNWLMGDRICHVDFLLFEAMDRLNMMFPGIWSSFDNLAQFHDKFKEIPQIKEYRMTSKKWPIFSPLALWGGKGEGPPQ